MAKRQKTAGLSFGGYEQKPLPVAAQKPLQVKGHEQKGGKGAGTLQVTGQEQKGGKGAGKQKVNDGYACDGCSGPIIGKRFHSLEWENFDLCEGCHGRPPADRFNAIGALPNHKFVALTQLDAKASVAAARPQNEPSKERKLIKIEQALPKATVAKAPELEESKLSYGRCAEAEPYGWPCTGEIGPANTALIIIDMQTDFCAKGGYMDMMGYDINSTARAIKPIREVLAVARELGYWVIHTREGHRPDLSDLPANKVWRSKQNGLSGIGDQGPKGRILIRGEEGWDIIPELYPKDGEPVIDKTGKGSFYATDLDIILRQQGIKNLIITGIATDTSVHSTLREANDRGYECVVLDDCTGASDMKNHLAALNMVKMQGGVFGTVSNSHKVILALRREKRLRAWLGKKAVHKA